MAEVPVGQDKPKKLTPMNIVSQVMLFVGALSMVWVGDGNPWGFMIAMGVQPFWYYISITSKNWGLLGASTVYTYAWALGIYNNWPRLYNDMADILARIHVWLAT